MAHAVSASILRFDRMSPTAAGMAATLHLLVALALFVATPHRNYEVPEQSVDITMEEPPQPPAAPQDQPKEQPKAQPEPPAPAAQAKPAAPPAAASPKSLGLPPVVSKPTMTDTPKSVPLGLPPPTEKKAETPQQAAAQPEPKAEAKPEPKPEPQPEVPPPGQAESKLPPVETPAAPLTMQDFVRAAPPPPPQDIVKPQPRIQPTPQPQTPTVQQLTPPQLQPSPLHTNQSAPSSQQSASAAFVNPADNANRSRIVEAYLWDVGRKMSERRAFAATGSEHGNVVLRLTIARDGRLMDASVARSSGSNNLDSAGIALARAASPYAPLPAELTGNQVTFVLPLSYRKE